MKKYKNVHILSIIVFISAFGFLYGGSFYGMAVDWYNDPNYSHGFLIPVISGYLFWQRRYRLENVAIFPLNSGILIIVTGLLIYLIGNLSGESYTMRFSMLIVLTGAILFTCGIELFKTVLFPFSYLIFMIPLPYLIYDSVAFPLKLLVSELSVEFLSMIGVIVMREGNIIHLVDTTLEVADACSGIRSIISLLALSTALAYLTQNGWLKRLMLTFLAVPISVLVNALRVISTGVLADKYGAKVAEGFFHEFAGLMIFGVAIVMLILSAVILSKIKKG